MIYIKDYNHSTLVAVTLLEANKNATLNFEFTITNQATNEVFENTFTDISSNRSRYNLFNINVSADLNTKTKGFYEYSIAQSSVILETGLMYVDGPDTDFEISVYK